MLDEMAYWVILYIKFQFILAFIGAVVALFTFIWEAFND